MDKVPAGSIVADLTELSSHLEQLAEEVFSLEQAVEMGSSSEVLDHSAIRQFQRLDFLRQSLEDCALLTHLLCQVERGALPRHAVGERLMLETTRALLRPTEPPKGQTMQITGEVDLF